MLDLCIAAKLRILNGRTVGDAFGKYTCHKSHGSSVNDYVIVSEDILNKMLYFNVLPFQGDLSDHCGISFAVKCLYYETTEQDEQISTFHNFPIQFKWDRNNIFTFQQAFRNDNINNNNNK